MTQPFPLTNVLRDDEVTDSLDRDEVLAAAPEVEDGRFKVPPIIGLAEDGEGKANAMTALEIAAAVRRGAQRRRRARGTLAAIASRDEDIHAFNLVLVEEPRLAAAAVDAAVVAGDDPGPLAGVPVALKDNLCTRGIPTTCSSHPRGLEAAVRRHRRHAAEGGRR